MARTFIDLTQLLDANIPLYPGDPPFSSRPSSTVLSDGYSVHALSCSSHAGTHLDAPSHFFSDGPTVDQLPPSTFILPALVLDVTHKKARECIAWDSVEPAADRIRPGIAVLFRTGWSRYWDRTSISTSSSTPSSPLNMGLGGPAAHHYFDHPWLAADVAERLLALGVRVVGSDTMSPDQSPLPGPESAVVSSSGGGGGDETGTVGEELVFFFGVHSAILGAGGVIVENLTNLDLLQAAQDAVGPGDEVIVSLLPLKITGCDGAPIRAVGWLQPRGFFS
ncbi:hypothetical protein BC827DRAFT_1265436 [Russula dissimulans]|nr:hypothetical protein BC827DRAFT_1265436 [Russula dissimulans]